MDKPTDHVARRTFTIEALVYEPPFLGSTIWSTLWVGEDIAVLASHRPVRLRS
jgi:hypothetical protein